MKTLARALILASSLALATPAFADDSVEMVNMSIYITNAMARIDVQLAMRGATMDQATVTRLREMRSRAIDLYKEGKLREAQDLLARMLSDMSLGGR